jgi:uncharacterized RDD family membrane protein YckC
MMQQQDEKEILREEREEMNFADPASKTTRFLNYIIDQVAISVIIQGVHFGIAYLMLGAKYKDHIFYNLDFGLESLRTGLWVSIPVSFLYYFIFESATHGRTLGKIITDSIAITQDGTPFTPKHALIRTLCRFIPFEMLSALFAYLPWHDSLSKTAVVIKTWK